jgi:hypothetical protein
MKKAGVLLITLGIFSAYLAFKMDVVVDRIYNIGLLDERQNIVFLSGILFLAGIILFGFGVVAKEELISQVFSGGTDQNIKSGETDQNIKYDSDYFINNDDFIHNEDGTVTHKSTGLMWQRFSIGQTWNGETCVGNPKKMSWDEAMMLKSDFAGYNNWRLPTKDALMTLVSANKNKKGGLYWSSSPSADYSSSAWYIDFDSGLSYQHNRGYDHCVRLVRKS